MVLHAGNGVLLGAAVSVLGPVTVGAAAKVLQYFSLRPCHTARALLAEHVVRTGCYAHAVASWPASGCLLQLLQLYLSARIFRRLCDI